MRSSPRLLGVFTDAEALTVINRVSDDSGALAYLDHQTAALPYHLLQRPRILVLGAGGGSDVLRALRHGAAHVDAVELDPELIRLVRHEFSAFSGSIYDHRDVTAPIAEARSFVEAIPGNTKPAYRVFPHGQACTRRDTMTSDEPSPETNKAYAIGLARAFGGAVIFAIPLLMTMEMWSLAFTMGRGRLLFFMTINFAVLVGLSYFAGFEKTFSWKDDALDAFAAFGVGVITSTAILAMFAVITSDMTWSEIVGKVALQSVPASLGAMLGRKQLGAEQDTGAEDERKREAGYGGELFQMLAGSAARLVI